jgi:predicted DNA-binding transcriptional regulator AlpA
VQAAESVFGGAAGSQTPTSLNADRNGAGSPAGPSAALASRRFIGLGQIAEKFGVSERTAHKIIAEPWFPAALDFAPRVRRWVEQEIDAAAIARAPRRLEREPEPVNLLRGKVDKLKRGEASA